MYTDATPAKIAQALMAHLDRRAEILVNLNDYAEFENICDALSDLGCRFERMPQQLQIVLHRSPPAPISDIAILADIATGSETQFESAAQMSSTV